MEKLTLPKLLVRFCPVKLTVTLVNAISSLKTNVKFWPIRFTCWLRSTTTEFKERVNCCPVKETLAVPVTVSSPNADVKFSPIKETLAQMLSDKTHAQYQVGTHALRQSFPKKHYFAQQSWAK